MLDARVVDEDVYRAQFRGAALDQRAHFGRLGKVRTVVAHAYLELAGQAFAQCRDRRCVTKAVQHQVGARTAQSTRYAKPDAAGRTGDHGHFPVELCHRLSLLRRVKQRV